MRDGQTAEQRCVRWGPVEGPRGRIGNGWLGASLRCRSVAGGRPFAQGGGSQGQQGLQGRAFLSCPQLSHGERMCCGGLMRVRVVVLSVTAPIPFKLFRCCEPGMIDL